MQESFGFPFLRLSAAILPTGKNGLGTLLDTAGLMNGEFSDETLEVQLDTGDPDEEQTANRVLFSRKLLYLLSHRIRDSAKLIVDRMRTRMA